jgi:hypothetical protein
MSYHLAKSTFVTRFLVPLLTELAQKIKQLVKLACGAQIDSKTTSKSR